MDEMRFTVYPAHGSFSYWQSQRPRFTDPERIHTDKDIPIFGTHLAGKSLNLNACRQAQIE